MPKMSGYVKTFKFNEENKDRNNKLMSFHTDDKKLLEQYKGIWTKIEDFKKHELNHLLVYDDRYRENKIRTYSDKVYTNFHGLNVSEDDIECESFTVTSIGSLLVYGSKYYLQVFLENCDQKTVNKQMADYLDENLFEDQIL